ncbi:hypothetical protein CDD83_4312 [Cordyceps sp. RAO-2017]|nr:hypothetical protein CDD83_4312 [Cordyceps sp. RAO-2017]
MDKLPRLRRKPKPPAIETSVRRASRDAVAADARPVDIMAPAVLSSLSPPGEPHQHPQHALALKSLSPVRKASPFRSFKIRASAKRARGSSPVDQPATASPVVAVFNQDGHAPHAACRSATHAQQQARPLRPEMPGFLTLSAQEIDRKFHEITWAERLRLADAHRNQHVDDYRWGHYQQLDCAQRGLMDRYSNIRPWNHNRVRLRVPDGEFDYVNASAVSLSSPSDPSLPPLRYIAMQGPTEPSFDCVWRMVAEQMPSPAVIVQLTMMHENGAVKCHQYFPHARGDPPWTLNEADAWADGWSARLTLASLHHAAEGAIEVRKLLLDVAGAPEPRVVWHLLTWTASSS